MAESSNTDLNNVVVVFFTRTKKTGNVAQKITKLLEGKNINVKLVQMSVKGNSYDGVFGYMKGGYHAGRKSDVDIIFDDGKEDPDVDWAKVDHLILGAPVWNWSLNPTLLTFMTKYASKFADIPYSMFHSMGASGHDVARKIAFKTVGRLPVAQLAVSEKIHWSKGDEFVEGMVGEFMDAIVEWQAKGGGIEETKKIEFVHWEHKDK